MTGASLATVTPMIAAENDPPPDWNARVAEALRAVPRDRFSELDCEQTSSSDPSATADSVEALELDGRERVLVVGARTAYHAAVLSKLARSVFSIECVAEGFAQESVELLRALGCTNVELRSGDGRRGWPEMAPFDRMLLTAALDEVPVGLIEQLAHAGILVLPFAALGRWPSLLRIRKRAGTFDVEDLGPVGFVPMLPRV